MTYSWRYSTTKKTKNTLAPCSAETQAPSHFSGSKFAGNGRCRAVMLQMKAPGGMLCSSLRRRVKLDIRRCVAVAPPASADLIKAQTGAIWRKDLKIKSFSAVPFSPRSYCLTFRLHVSWVLNSPSLNSLISCCCFFFYFLSSFALLR